MTAYKVYLRTVASASIDVEAESEEEAIELAFDQAPYLCAQCSGWGRKAGIELGEWSMADEPWPAFPGDVAIEVVGE